MASISNKFHIVFFVILFAISSAILLIASTAETPVPAWAGYLDVGIVVLIVFTGFMIHQRNRAAPPYAISYQVAMYLFPLMIVGMWLARDSLDFNILLPGVAWRIYLFLSVLPPMINLWKAE